LTSSFFFFIYLGFITSNMRNFSSNEYWSIFAHCTWSMV